MDLMDKSLVLDMLRLPRLGLSPDQVLKIERIIDGKPAQEPRRPWVSFRDAAAALGFKTRQAVSNWVRDGVLDAYVPSGRKLAVGVTRESLERVLERRAG